MYAKSYKENKMKIHKIKVGLHEANCYIASKENEAFIIDPGADANKILSYIRKNHLNVRGIILTHAHYDHTGAANEIRTAYGCSIYAHKKEAAALSDPVINGSLGISVPVSVDADILLGDGDIVKYEDIELEIINSPGHTEGSMCIKVKGEDIIFTGDTIFCDDIGRTDLASGDERKLLKTIKNKVCKWPDETVIYPGHDESCTMQKVKKILPCK